MKCKKCKKLMYGNICIHCNNKTSVSAVASNDGVMLDLRNNAGRLFIQKYVKEEHRKLKLGIKTPTIAALERCIDLEDQLQKLKA